MALHGIGYSVHRNGGVLPRSGGLMQTLRINSDGSSSFTSGSKVLNVGSLKDGNGENVVVEEVRRVEDGSTAVPATFGASGCVVLPSPKKVVKGSGTVTTIGVGGSAKKGLPLGRASGRAKVLAVGGGENESESEQSEQLVMVKLCSDGEFEENGVTREDIRRRGMMEYQLYRGIDGSWMIPCYDSDVQAVKLSLLQSELKQLKERHSGSGVPSDLVKVYHLCHCGKDSSGGYFLMESYVHRNGGFGGMEMYPSARMGTSTG